MIHRSLESELIDHPEQSFVPTSPSASASHLIFIKKERSFSFLKSSQRKNNFSETKDVIIISIVVLVVVILVIMHAQRTFMNAAGGETYARGLMTLIRRRRRMSENAGKKASYTEKRRPKDRMLCRKYVHSFIHPLERRISIESAKDERGKTRFRFRRMWDAGEQETGGKEKEEICLTAHFRLKRVVACD